MVAPPAKSPVTALAPPLVARLLDPAAYPHPTADIRLIETHISWVFLTGDFAYKVKKPCDLGFLDFSTLQKRHHFCAEEVRLNRRFAPELYLGIVPITGPAEAATLDGAGEPIEWAVKMRQFDDRGRLDRLFEERGLTAADCEHLGVQIARVEERLAIADPRHGWGSAEAFRGTVAMNLDQLRSARPEAADRATSLQAWVDSAVESSRAAIAARAAAGKIRECHGDLHLANIVLHGGRMTAFDGIEFNDSLRWIDVANDVAFLAMDLRARGRPDFAARLLSAWMEAADDHAAVAVLPLYMVYRAIVRAAVAAIRRRQCADAGDTAGATAAAADVDRYLDLAERLTAPLPPRLFITSGVSGTGKTTLAARIVDACGAVRLRSDVERKRLAGMAATERPADDGHAADLYSSAMTARVYARLVALATTVLRAGTSVVIDATCNARAQRDGLAAVGRDAGVPIVWLELDVPAEFVLARVAARQAAGTDASDASIDVVRAQLAGRQPITPEEVAATPGARLVHVTPWDAEDPGFVRRITT
jgi:aminoglycoside phosphotransferase family enzyme/predicted kinase